MHNLLPSIIVFMMIGYYCSLFWLIENPPCGTAMPCGTATPRDILALVALIQSKCVWLTRWFIPPTKLLFSTKSLPVTAHLTSIIFLQTQFSVMQHNEPGENMMMHSVLGVLVSLIPPRFHCIDHHQPRFSDLIWSRCWPNQSSNIVCGTHMQLLCDSPIINRIVQLNIRFIIYLPVVFTVIRIIQVTIAVMPIFGVPIAFRCTILMTFSWMMVDSLYSGDIQYWRATFREVLWR